jgi:excisionase family DNA binding protein
MAEMQMFLNAAQTAEMLGLSTATIRKWVLAGFIPYKKIGRAVRFSVAEIRDWAMSKNVAPPESWQLQNDAHETNGGEK